MPSLTQPLVTIGIPVFEKERYLRATLDSALAQTHQNLEIILADNGSTDASAAICREYCERDERVRFVQNRRNLGSRRNFNLVFELAHGDYFVWGRGHDLWQPGFVAAAVELLERDDDVVLVHTRCEEIDEDGQAMGPMIEDLDTRGLDQKTRLTATWQEITGPATLGVIRTEAMDRTRLYRDMGGCDIVFLLELAVVGAFAFVEEPLLALRMLRSESSEEQTVRRTWAQLNPFHTRLEHPHCHVLEYIGAHVEIVRSLAVPASVRDELLADLVGCHGEKFGGSLTRALDVIADQVDTAAAVASQDEEGAMDCATALRLLEQVNTALLFQPDHKRARSIREALSRVLIELTELPNSPAASPEPSPAS